MCAFLFRYYREADTGTILHADGDACDNHPPAVSGGGAAREEMPF